jgi:hypothetical protein
MDEHDEALEDKGTANSDKLREVYDRAMRRFDETVLPQQEMRAEALTARRFISIPGAQWEGDWGEQYQNSIKVEIDKVSKGVEKIVRDYRENRIVPDFRPAGGNSDNHTANTLDGLHRADSYHFKAQQARDNAFEEAATGGFGAWRLRNEWADPFDKDSDAQRINPGMTIVDADQSVFFDGNSKLYDKSDARFAFVVTGMSRDAFEEAYPGCQTTWPDAMLKRTYDWFAPDINRVCEYYEVEDRDEKLLILTLPITGEEERHWSSDIDAEELTERKAKGWAVATRNQKRRRVHKYVLSGAEVMKDQGTIAGAMIPIVPVYGKRWYVDGIERFRGHVSKRMDSQRMYNAKVSKLSETDALAPREIPIFAASQMPPHLAELWAKQNIERHPYALVEPLFDPSNGQMISAGPIGKVEPPQLAPVTAALLQIASGDLMDDEQDGADEVKSNTSAEAMDIAAARIDAKSGLYLDNMRQSVQREGEIYLSMCTEVYSEEGRVVETMTEDGDDGEATLVESYTDDRGRYSVRNDFATGKYKVQASVTEATATRRDKTVRQMLNLAAISTEAQDLEGAQGAIITAALNMEGEGTDDFIAWQRKRALKLGLVKPTEEEAAQMAEAQQQQPPDPTQILSEAQAEALKAGAAKDLKLADKAEADTALSEARAIETLADAHQKGAQARAANDTMPAAPRIRFGHEFA